MKFEDLKSAVALFHKGNAYRAHALMVIHDDEMYLEDDYETFKAFIEHALKIQESTAYRLIRYARLLENVGLSIWTADAIPSEGALREMASSEDGQDLYREALERVNGDPGKITKRVADEVTGARNKSSKGKKRKPPKKATTKTTGDRLREIVCEHHTRLCPDRKAHDFLYAFGQHPMFREQLHAEIQVVESVKVWLDDYVKNLSAYTVRQAA